VQPPIASFHSFCFHSFGSEPPDYCKGMVWYNDFEDDCANYGGYGGPRNMSDGHYEPGTRKCSKCKEFKTKADFNKEQSAKTAAKRVCNQCGAPVPKDLTVLTVPQLKDIFIKRKVPVPKGSLNRLPSTPSPSHLLVLSPSLSLSHTQSIHLLLSFLSLSPFPVTLPLPVTQPCHPFPYPIPILV
jgi:hypothetical protein